MRIRTHSIRYACVAAMTMLTTLSGQVTGLAGWDIFLDPGHAGTDQNVGIFGYSEPECQLQVGLQLRDLLLINTDIDTVYMSRYTDQDMANMDRTGSLLQRIDVANSLQASWYHSLHSNAGSSTANNVLMLWGQYTDGNEKVPVGGKAMSSIMLDKLSGGMRITALGSFGDCTFYGGTNCPYLAVNRLTTMASELSEAGFHTHPVQNQLKMSASWQRLEAYSFYWPILEYHEIERPPVSILTGIIRNLESGVPINGATATAGGIADTTDTYESLFHKYSTDPEQLHNGFYFLENVAGETVDLIVSAPGYYPDTLEVAMIDTFFTFEDVNLVSSMPPTVVMTIPAEGDSVFPSWDPIIIRFSRPMNPTSFEATFIAPGGITGTYSWGDDNQQVTFTPDSALGFLTEYTMVISGEAQDAYGHPFDGNVDGTGGDGLVITFTTGPEDLAPPELVALYPVSYSTGTELLPLINLEYNEEIDDNSILTGTINLVRYSGLVPVPGEVRHYVVGGRSTLNFFPQERLWAHQTYLINIEPGLRDVLGNEETVRRDFRFTTGDQTYDATVIDNFESGVGNWWPPTESGSTIGYADSLNIRSGENTMVNLLTGSGTSMELSYAWDTLAATWLIREHLSGGTPQNVYFNDEYNMQVYMFGDGSGNKFRFCVDDSQPSMTTAGHEVSPWYTIDWIGWRLVSWDMLFDGTGTWIGDGNLDGSMRFDSFQITYVPGNPSYGTLYFDDLRIAMPRTYEVADGEGSLPIEFALHGNYPNPFNPSTTITYEVPLGTQGRLTVYNLLGQPVRRLVKGWMEPGRYQAVWDGRDDAGQPLASGVYIYSLEAGDVHLSRKMVLTK
ncbi:MAG: Ig-like domain-containing protein [Fidelibacterota bacterium]|nr:MAG: Ig-like domain-containing protein [Candidatus Neomarinimicrobiota bacterium]